MFFNIFCHIKLLSVSSTSWAVGAWFDGDLFLIDIHEKNFVHEISMGNKDRDQMLLDGYLPGSVICAQFSSYIYWLTFNRGHSVSTSFLIDIRKVAPLEVGLLAHVLFFSLSHCYRHFWLRCGPHFLWCWLLVKYLSVGSDVTSLCLLQVGVLGWKNKIQLKRYVLPFIMRDSANYGIFDKPMIKLISVRSSNWAGLQLQRINYDFFLP